MTRTELNAQWNSWVGRMNTLLVERPTTVAQVIQRNTQLAETLSQMLLLLKVTPTDILEAIRLRETQPPTAARADAERHRICDLWGELDLGQ